jgi:DNA-directed RNA polymerase specialized sigma24 family protein
MTMREKQRRGKAEWVNRILTAEWRADIQCRIRSTVATFGVRLSAECVEDLVQEVLLRLWQYGAVDKLRTSPAYVRQVATNATIDSLRREGAKKRSTCQALSFDAAVLLWQPSRTPEEIVLAREEARQVLAKDRVLRKKVEREIRRQHVKRPTHEKGRRGSHEKRRSSRKH